MRTDFLIDLVLLRNDPALVETVRQETLADNSHAQYALGLIHAEGRGVDPVLVAACVWLTIAVLQGDRDAEILRNIVAVQMTDREFEQGKRRAAEYQQAIHRNAGITPTDRERINL